MRSVHSRECFLGKSTLKDSGRNEASADALFDITTQETSDGALKYDFIPDLGPQHHTTNASRVKTVQFHAGCMVALFSNCGALCVSVVCVVFCAQDKMWIAPCSGKESTESGGCFPFCSLIAFSKEQSLDIRSQVVEVAAFFKHSPVHDGI